MSVENMHNAIKELYAVYCTNPEQAIPLLLPLLDENVHWCSLADGCKGAEFTRERNGIAEVQNYFEELAGAWEMVRFCADEFVCENDRVVMIGSCAWKHRGSGNTIDTPKIDIWKTRNGKIIEFHEYYDTAKLVQDSS